MDVTVGPEVEVRPLAFSLGGPISRFLDSSLRGVGGEDGSVQECPFQCRSFGVTDRSRGSVEKLKGEENKRPQKGGRL